MSDDGLIYNATSASMSLRSVLASVAAGLSSTARAGHRCSTAV